MAIDIRGGAPMFQVFDMPTSLAFYCDALGFEVVQSAGRAPRYGWVRLRHGEFELMLNTQYEDDARPPAPELVRTAAHGDASIYFGCPDPDAAYAYLRSRGVAAEPPAVASYGMKQVYVRDPDGYVLCFQWRADGDSEA